MRSCAEHGSPSPNRGHEPRTDGPAADILGRNCPGTSRWPDHPRGARLSSASVIGEQVTIVNALGLHARAAAKFVGLAKTFSSDIQLRLEDREAANGKSIMAVMMLAAAQGTPLTLQVSGEDEAEAFAALKALINDRFGEAE